MFPPALTTRAAALLETYRGRGWKLATAESCTGGLICALLTEIPGSSDVVERGFVTYSNEAKQELIGVPAAILAEHGAVSEPTARAMAFGAHARSKADVAVSVTGVAGPGGEASKSPSASCISPVPGQANGLSRSSAGSATSAAPKSAAPRSNRRSLCWRMRRRVVKRRLRRPRIEKTTHGE